MVKESDLSEASRNSFLTQYAFEIFDDKPWTPAPEAKDRRLAIVSTAAIHAPDDRPFGYGAFHWRSFPSSQRDFLCSHNSVNWDRTGMYQDINIAYPIDRVNEACADGHIGSVASTHYAFNGGTYEVAKYEPYAKEVAGLMKEDGVNTVLLCPV